MEQLPFPIPAPQRPIRYEGAIDQRPRPEQRLVDHLHELEEMFVAANAQGTQEEGD